MRYINNRNKEPKELVEYRKTSGVVYDDLGKERKDIIRDCLLDEQGYICAYCMGRISSSTCTIDGVCINDSEHCDKKRGNVPLKILDPHNPLCEEFVTYSFSGRILPTGREEDKVKEDIQTLGLDCDKLVKLRKAVWDEIWERFIKDHEKKKWSKELFLEYASKYRTKQCKRHGIMKFHAYCNFIAWGFEQYANKY